MSESILQEAERIINGERQDQYGSPERNLDRIACLWNAYLRGPYGEASIPELGPDDVAWMMVLLKMARQMNAPKRDNLVDAAGYIGLIEKIS
jgi:hypothetical protein